MSGQARDREEEAVTGEVDPRRRATLLESQAAELRDRLDALLDEIARHHQRSPAERLRRFAVPATCTLLLAGAALMVWRRWRRQEIWMRLGARAHSQMNRLLA